MRLVKIVSAFALLLGVSSAQAYDNFFSVDQCKSADMGAIERAVGRGFADLIFPDLQNKFAESGIKIKRSQLETIDFSTAMTIISQLATRS